MTFIQRIIAGGCGYPEHGTCQVIDCITTEPVIHHETGEVIHEAGAVVWHSHMDAAIHPGHRLNPDHPAEDHRGAEPVPVTVTPLCDNCRAHPAAQGSFGLPPP